MMRSIDAVIALYDGLQNDADQQFEAVTLQIGTELASLSKSFGRHALFKTEEGMLDEFLESAMLPRKVANMLYNKLKDEAYSVSVC